MMRDVMCLVGIVDVCVKMQATVAALSDQVQAELRRHYYVTPTSYLELISTFKTLFATKRASVAAQKSR